MQVLFDALINYTPGVEHVLTLKTLARVSDSDVQMTYTIIAGCSLVNPNRHWDIAPHGSLKAKEIKSLLTKSQIKSVNVLDTRRLCPQAFYGVSGLGHPICKGGESCCSSRSTLLR